MSTAENRENEPDGGVVEAANDQLAEETFPSPWHQADGETPSQPAPQVRDTLSDVYRHLLPEFFDRPFEPEKRATCGDCAMCSTEDPAMSGVSSHFKPDVKCCSYHPLLPNYQVGALLADDRPGLAEGQRRVRARIREGHGIVPQGVGAPPAYDVLYQKVSQAEGFGRSQGMLCPFFVRPSGSCSIWPYREAVCSTFYCKHDRGADGQAFWTRLMDYQVELQSSLISYALLELDWDPERLERPSEPRVTAEEMDGQPPEARAYKNLWGDWAGREEELYLEAFEIVRRLTPSDVERIGGVRLRAQLQRLARSHQNIYNPKPLPILRRNPEMQVRRDAEGRYLLNAYRPLDPSRVRKPVLEAVDAFDGRRSTEEVIESLKAEGRPIPNESLLRRLYQHRILIDAEDTGGA